MWLLSQPPPLIDAAYVINGDAGGGGIAPDGRYLAFGVQAGEKLYADFTLETTHEGGHSSRPVTENPIYRLARALSSVETLPLPHRGQVRTQPFSRSRHHRVGRQGGRSPGGRRDCRRTWPPWRALPRRSESERAVAHDLCRHAGDRRARAKRAATARARKRQLPHPARRHTREIRAALVKAIDDPAVTVTHAAGFRRPQRFGSIRR